MKEPQFSVVVPLYNKGPHIARAIKSVLLQTEVIWELIIVDDGSTDEGPEIVKSFEDKRIRLVVQGNAGPSAARNRGVDEAKFEYIAFLDADDEWKEGHLQSQSRAIAEFPNAGIYASAYLVHEPSGREYTPKYYKISNKIERQQLKNYFINAKPGVLPVWTSTVVVKKLVMKDLGGFPTDMPRGQDVECWSKIAVHHEVVFSHFVGAIYYKDSVNRSDKRKRSEERKLYVEYALEQGMVPKAKVFGLKIYIQRIKLRNLLNLIRSGDYELARKLLKKLPAPVNFVSLINQIKVRLRLLVPKKLISLKRKIK